MRPQQQNRRMRGRNNNNNNRKGPNPLTRSYESNGPDVKIRGSAQQIAEKYGALARDAMSSGDRVMAENYLQHAEHYNRIIAAAQAQMPIQNVQNRDDFDDDMDDDGGDFDRPAGVSEGAGATQDAGAGPQPVIDGVPAEVALNSENGQRENNGRRENFRNRERRERGYQNGHRNGEGRPQDDQPRDAQASDDAGADADSLPAFLTGETASPAAEAAPEEPRRTRRPRRGERRRDEQAGEDGSAPQEVAQGGGEAPAVAASDE
ncbi:MAG: DUF4167 domain-containing protein [Rhizobiaceae bacterium]|nr:DUF4167 domain-containing protein [Rhizobiaceae bacterium]